MLATVAVTDNLVTADTVAAGEIADSGTLANNGCTFSVATYPLSIRFGFYAIVSVKRLQPRRIRELAEDGPYAAKSATN